MSPAIAIALAFVAASPGDKLIRSNIGAIISRHGGTAEDTLIFSVNFDALASGCKSSPAMIDGQTYQHNRSGAKQCLIGGAYTTCATDEFCVNENGITLDGGINRILRSDELDVAPWAKTNAAVAVTANACSGPMGATMERIDNTAATATDGVTQTSTLDNTNAPGFFAWMRSSSGTTSGTLRITHPTATSFSQGWCYRSDGGTCTVTLGPGAVCRGTTTLSTTPVLVSLKCEASGGVIVTNTPTLQVIPGDFTTSSSTLCAGSTMNTGTVTPVPSYTPTTTTAATTSIAANSNLTLSRGDRTVAGTYCVTARHWQTIPTNQFSYSGAFMQTGIDGAANSFRFDGGPVADVRSTIRDDAGTQTITTWPALPGAVYLVPQVYTLSANAGTSTLRRDGTLLTKTVDTGTEPRVLTSVVSPVRAIDSASVGGIGTMSSISMHARICP